MKSWETLTKRKGRDVLLEMDDSAIEDFRRKRQEILDLGLTEEQYDQMIAAGVNWILEVNTIIQNYILVSEARHDLIHAALGNAAKVMMSSLEYAYRLLKWEYDPEKFDLETFEKDRKDVLEILKADWLANPSLTTFNLRFL